MEVVVIEVVGTLVVVVVVQGVMAPMDLRPAVVQVPAPAPVRAPVAQLAC